MIHIILTGEHCLEHVYFYTAASLSGPSGLVSEGAGQVMVCVDVINANSIPSGGANIEVFISENAGLNPATRKQILIPLMMFWCACTCYQLYAIVKSHQCYAVVKSRFRWSGLSAGQ